MGNGGALTEAVYYILLTLLQPRHGYGMMQAVESLTGGRVRLAAGTLYGAISTMLDKGWITALPGEGEGRRKEYRITGEGLSVLREELARLEELAANGKKLLEERDHEGNLL